MSIWFILSLIGNGVLSIIIYIGWEALTNVIGMHNKLQRNYDNVRYELARKSTFTQTTSVVKQSFDAKTIALIKLSVGNNNQDEARNAAVEACKRIHKVIK